MTKPLRNRYQWLLVAGSITPLYIATENFRKLQCIHDACVQYIFGKWIGLKIKNIKLVAAEMQFLTKPLRNQYHEIKFKYKNNLKQKYWVFCIRERNKCVNNKPNFNEIGNHISRLFEEDISFKYNQKISTIVEFSSLYNLKYIYISITSCYSLYLCISQNDFNVSLQFLFYSKSLVFNTSYSSLQRYELWTRNNFLLITSVFFIFFFCVDAQKIPKDFSSTDFITTIISYYTTHTCQLATNDYKLPPSKHIFIHLIRTTNNFFRRMIKWNIKCFTYIIEIWYLILIYILLIFIPSFTNFFSKKSINWKSILDIVTGHWLSLYNLNICNWKGI